MSSEDRCYDTFIEDIQVIAPRRQLPDAAQQRYTGAIPKNASPPTSALLKQKAEHLPKNFAPMVDLINKGTRVCVLMRGLPGSGKSFIAYQLVEETVKTAENHIVSADQYFTNKMGRYNFDSSKLSEAHEFTQRQFTQLACQGVSPLIVDNTNMCYWEMYYYLQVAVQYKYHVEIMEPATPWMLRPDILKQKNTHAVPEATIKNMRAKYEAGGTVADLIRSLSLDPNYTPEMRRIPPIVKEAPKKLNPFIDFGEESAIPSPSEWKQQEKVRMSVEVDSSEKKADSVFNWAPPAQIFDQAWEAAKSNKEPAVEAKIAEPDPQPQRKIRKNKKSNSPAKVLKPHSKNCPNENPDFTTVRDCYPSVKDSCLWDLFDRCNGDAQWCLNLLCDENLADQMDGGSDLSCACFGADITKAVATEVKVDEKQKPKSPVAKPKKSKETVKQIDLEEWLATKKIIEKGITIGAEHYPDHVNAVKNWKKPQQEIAQAVAEFVEPEVSSTNRDSPDSADELHALPITNELILELDEKYGGGLLTHVMGDKTFPPTIFIKRSTAHLLYLDIMDAYYSQCEEQKLSTLKQDEELAKKLSKEDEINFLVAKSANNVPKKTVADLIDFGGNVVENNWSTVDSADDIALKMSKEKLMQLFPDIEKEFLMNIFAGNNHNFDDTVASVEDSLFLSPEQRAEVAKAKKKIFNTQWAPKVEKSKEVREEVASTEQNGYTPGHLRTVEVLYQDIKHHFEEHRVCVVKAEEAIRAKNYELATYLSSIAQFHKQKGQESKHEVANLVASIHENTQPSETSLDLHFFNQIEAEMILNTFLDKRISRLRAITKPYEEVFVITGRGRHSENGKAPIKARTKQVLRQRGLK